MVCNINVYMISRDNIINWLENINYVDELSEYCNFDISKTAKEQGIEAANKAINYLNEIGFSDIRSFETDGNDVIYAARKISKNNPTILIYGHYDVQPIGNISKWKTEPNISVVKNGKLYGRGTADNRGQHFAHFMALKYLSLFHPDIFDKINIKIILDGNEEEGSPYIGKVLEENTDLFDADFVYVSDGPSLSMDTPSIIGSVRGILSFQIDIQYHKDDLHSGNFGGIARSAPRDIFSLVTSMVDPNGKVLIDGFYDNVQKPMQEELDAQKTIEKLLNELIETRNIIVAPTFDNKSNFELSELYPTMNINGIRSGGVDENRRTIIPGKASVSIDCRLVPDQNPNRIKLLITEFVKKWGEKMKIQENIKLHFEPAMYPIKSSLNSPYFELVKKAVENGFNKKSIIVPRLGGSLPIYLFDYFLKKPVILVPYALPDENNHSPNENLDLEFFKNGVASTVLLIYSMLKNK